MGRGPSIEARKNAVDAQRGKIFTKIIREIGVAARGGGGDPVGQPAPARGGRQGRCRSNMSKDVIERAIKKATGELEGVVYEEIRYEGYAPGGVAVIVDCLTDNKVRTVADVRHAFGKFGGNLGTDGSVSFMFKKLGVLSFAAGVDEDKVTELAIDAGADDVVVYPDDGAIDVVTAPDAFAAVKGAMEAAGLSADHRRSDDACRQRHRRGRRDRAAGRQAAALAGRHGRRPERVLQRRPRRRRLRLMSGIGDPGFGIRGRAGMAAVRVAPCRLLAATGPA